MGGSSSILSPSSPSPIAIATTPSALKSLKINSILGKGGYATVYRVNEKSSQEIAVKRTKFHPNHLECDVNMAITELEALKRVSDHSFITKVHGAFHLTTCCYLLLEYHSGGDLRFHFKPSVLFTEQQVAYFVSCVGSALHHLHLRGILHRDIKPENILLSSQGVPKLADFGTAYIEEYYSVKICDSSSGTIAYMAPEALTTSKYHSYQSDYWSLGITAFELLFACRPFSHCPEKMIHFVGNEYQSLWNRILLDQAMEHSRRNSNHLNHCPIVMDQFLDFQKVNESITSEERQADCLFPLSLQTSSDDPSLFIQIPQRTAAGLPISSACLDFLRAVLDPRIPHRLGQMSQFHLFSCHQWFRNYHYHFQDKSLDTIPSAALTASTTSVPPPSSTSSSSCSMKSPFLPTPSAVETCLELRYRHERIPSDLLSFPDYGETTTPPLSEDLQKKLEGYQFPPPSPPRLLNHSPFRPTAKSHLTVPSFSASFE
jgi:serine/threonine protein kinase